MKKLLQFSAILLMCLLALSACQGKGWPSRTITIVVSSGAGGGTDLGNRAIGAAMEGILGAKISVVNNNAGGGGAAADQVFSAKHDGYMWLGFFEGIFSNAPMGAHPGTSKDWDYFLLGGTPGLMSVAENSRFKSAADVIDAMKKDPGNIRLACSSTGTIWDIKSTLLAEAAGVEYKYMPYQGSNPSILALIAGEVDVIITGLGEQVEFLEARKITPIAMIELYGMKVPGFDNEIPSVCDAAPEMKKFLPINQTIGFAIPADTPADVKNKISDAFAKAMETPTIKDYCNVKFVAPSGARGTEAKDIAKKMESTLGWILFDKGVAPTSPEKFGIPRP